MASDISYYLLQFFNSIDYFAAALLFTFLIWEIFRFSKIFDPDWTNELFPEGGNIIDYVLFAIGIVSFILIKFNMKTILTIPYNSLLSLIFTIALLLIPIIIFLGLIGRFFKRMDEKMTIPAFIVNFILDFVHSVFFICFGAIVLSAASLILTIFL
jgi:hypothetical protein